MARHHSDFQGRRDTAYIQIPGDDMIVMMTSQGWHETTAMKKHCAVLLQALAAAVCAPVQHQ